MHKTWDIVYIGFILGEGGDAVQMLELAAGMKARGRNVKIIVPQLKTTQRFAERCRARDIEVELSPLLHADPNNAKQNLLSLVRLFLSIRAAILHFHTGDVCLPRTVLLALALFRPRHAFTTIHSPYSSMQPGEFRTRFWSKMASKYLEKVICPSKHGIRLQMRYGLPADKLETIYNCIDIKRFAGGDASAAYSALGISPRIPLVVFTSRLEQQKRPKDALEVFQRIGSDFRDAHLVYVGPGSQTEEIKSMIERDGLSDRVHIMGYQSNVADWLAAATVWIMLTESENFSLAILEALAAGCPILSTRCQGNDEILVHCENALTTEVGDIEAQVKALHLLLSDDDLRKRLRKNSLSCAQKFDVSNMIDQYEAAYYRTLS